VGNAIRSEVRHIVPNCKSIGLLVKNWRSESCRTALRVYGRWQF